MMLPATTEVHWIVRALWLFSVLVGLIAVLYACNQQMTINRWVTWEDLWWWMNDDWSGHRFNEEASNSDGKLQGNSSNQVPNHDPEANNSSGDDLSQHHGHNEANNSDGRLQGNSSNQFPNRNPEANNSGGETSECGQPFSVPDFSAVLLVSGPRVLLHYSLGAYMIGLAVYLGFVWQYRLKDTAAGPDDNRNIFIFFIFTFVVSYAIYFVSDIANLCKKRPWKEDYLTVKDFIDHKNTQCIGLKFLKPRKEEQMPRAVGSLKRCC